MSLIMTLSLLNGIVLTADSRVTCSKDGTVVGRADNEMKIYGLFEHGVGIAHCGNARMYGDKADDYINIALMWFVIRNLNESDTVSSIASKLYSYIKEIGHKGTHFWVAGFENDIPKIYMVNEDSLVWKNEEPVHGLWVDGISNFSDNSSDIWDEMNLEDAIYFSENYFKDLLSKQNDESITPEIRELLESCGGFVDMLVLDKDSIYWHSNKNFESENII